MADAKTTALTAATSWASGDLLYLVRDPAGTPVSRKITVDNILQNLVCAANTSLLKSSNGYSLTGSDASSMIDLAGTLNTTGSPAIIKVAMSNTASGATTKFLSFLAGASGTTEVLSVDKAGTVTLPDGLDASPSLRFASANSGFALVGGNIRVIRSGGLQAQFGSTAFQLATTLGVEFSFGSGPILIYDAANTLALRNAANAQAFNIYNTYTSGSVYERGFMRWVSNALQIGTEHVGASARSLEFRVGSNICMTFNTSGQLGGLSMTNSNTIIWAGGSYIFGSASTGAATGTMRIAGPTTTCLNFGGDTSSFPTIKRSTTILQARLADDSDYATFQGKIQTHANATSETPTATHTLRLFDAAGTEYRVLAIAV